MTAEIRELLELAAQAAGIDYVWDDTTSRLIPLVDGYPQHHWNPRESGDDLIDLMDKRSMAITWVDSFDEVICWILHGVGNENVTATEKISEHPTRKAALAMAVLRCAAEHGRRVKG